MKITESSIKVPESNLLSNPLVWNSLRKGDLVITEDLNKKKNKVTQVHCQMLNKKARRPKTIAILLQKKPSAKQPIFTKIVTLIVDFCVKNSIHVGLILLA